MAPRGVNRQKRVTKNISFKLCSIGCAAANCCSCYLLPAVDAAGCGILETIENKLHNPGLPGVVISVLTLPVCNISCPVCMRVSGRLQGAGSGSAAECLVVISEGCMT